MNWICTIYVAVLFFVLTPGVLLSLPPKSSKLVVAATHAVVFALIWHFTHKIVWRMSVGHEGFAEGYKQAKVISGEYVTTNTTCHPDDAKLFSKSKMGTLPKITSGTYKNKYANCIKDGKWVAQDTGENTNAW